MSRRHEPMLSATCRAEQHQPDDVTHVCRWITHPGAVHNCNCGHSWEDTFEDRVMAGFAPALVQTLRSHTKVAECTCGSTYETYEGPQPDCPVHGAIRAYNEAQAENERLRAERDTLKAAIERVREDATEQRRMTGVTRSPWRRGAHAQAVRTLRIVNAALDTPSIPGSPGSESCPLCDGAGVVPGTEEPETNTAGEPCDCVLRSESAACCDMHNIHCEPPGDLCCHDCAEAGHPEHPPGVRCVLDAPGGES